MPSWVWGLAFLAAGLLVFITFTYWSVGLLITVMGAYSITLFVASLRYDSVAWTAPIWPLTVVALLTLSMIRMGMRR